MSNKEHRNQVVISTTNLTKRFRKELAVDGLNLEVRRGEVFGLVGPDGAGKTTTIRMLAAIMDPTEGEATVSGFDTRKQAEDIKHHIGYMAQQFNLYPDLSVEENLIFFSDIFDVRGAEREARLEKLLDFARLTEFRNRRAGHLSGGMKKKLALACCLIHEPEILYLDEPTTGVDPVSRREFWDILSSLHARGTTIVVSTPYMDEAERCSRVGLMYEGRIIVCDTPDNIKGMIEGEMIELRPISATLFGVGRMRQAHRVIKDLEGIREVQMFGDLLHVFVDDAGRRIPEIERALQRHEMDTEGIRVTNPRMEEAYISLVRRQATQEAEEVVES